MELLKDVIAKRRQNSHDPNEEVIRSGTSTIITRHRRFVDVNFDRPSDMPTIAFADPANHRIYYRYRDFDSDREVLGIFREQNGLSQQTIFVIDETNAERFIGYDFFHVLLRTE